MDIKLSEKQIKNLCGTVSFKKGQTFYQTGKVKFRQYTDMYGEAVVKSTEQFVVRIEKEGAGQFITSCSCPTLGDFRKSCQHVAAVLIAIYNLNKNKAQSLPEDEYDERFISENSFLSIFKQKAAQTTSQQRHFEKREVLNVQFLITPVQLTVQDPVIGIQLQVNGEQIISVREFLTHINNRKPYRISQNTVYNFEQFCFDEQDDAILQFLIKIVEDEVLYNDMPVQNQEQHLLIIPPSSWYILSALISNTKNVSLYYRNKSYDEIKIATQPTALRFFMESKGEEYQLYIEGIERAVLLRGYRLVLFDGTLTQMSDDSMEQLFELKQMLKQKSLITIEHSHWDYFREQVIPKLKK